MWERGLVPLYLIQRFLSALHQTALELLLVEDRVGHNGGLTTWRDRDEHHREGDIAIIYPVALLELEVAKLFIIVNGSGSSHLLLAWTSYNCVERKLIPRIKQFILRFKPTRVIDCEADEDETDDGKYEGQVPRVPQESVDQVLDVPEDTNGAKDEEDSLLSVGGGGKQQHVHNEVEGAEVVVVVDGPSEEGCPSSPEHGNTWQVAPEGELLRGILIGNHEGGT